MRPIVLAGISAVMVALVFYTIAFVREQRRRRLDGSLLGFLLVGVAFDVTSAICMIAGAKGSILTPHSSVGFTALAIMIALAISTALSRKRAPGAEVPRGLHLFFRVAYALWVLMFLSTIAIGIVTRRGGQPPL